MTITANHKPLLSIILPSYNVSTKLKACLDSLDKLKEEIVHVEAVFVDDVSTDTTFEEIRDYAKTRDWVKYEQLATNSGSPSKPRNRGMELAEGTFVFFLDPDDEILVDGVKAELALAIEEQADVVRAPLIRRDAAGDVEMNKIPDWQNLSDNFARVKAMVKNHSTTVCGLYRLEFLKQHEIKWPTDLRLAEDAVFLYSMLRYAKVGYSEIPDFIYHTVVQNGAAASSTQQYEVRELNNQLVAWSRCTEILRSVGINYMAIRGQVALQTAFIHMIKFNRQGFERKDFNRLREFLMSHEAVVRSYTYGPRLKELLNLVLADDYENFIKCIKLRLLIAGYDLKFIEPVVQQLEEHYQVRIDAWSGHEKHDSAKSRELLNWADSIHCEWFLGNAVWYAQNKHPRQSLTVRLHRFELLRDYGHRADIDKIDQIISIAPHVMEEMISTFNFPRAKVSYIPNYTFTNEYEIGESPEKLFNLAMIGSVPKLKGYRRALELLAKLHKIDNRYNLTVYGKMPHELPWVANNPEDREYFAECDKFIERNGLKSAIKIGGWADMRTALKDKGFVLSMSDLEGSHQAVSDCFAAGNVALIWPWYGATKMYPKQYVHESIDSMVDTVLSCDTVLKHQNIAELGLKFVQENYSVEKFVERYVANFPTPTGIA